MNNRLYTTLFLLLQTFSLFAETDSFGYRGQIVLGNEANFQSIRTIGGGLTPSSLDDGVVEVTLTSPFTFYGESYSEVRMSTNGYLAFSNPPADDGTDFNNSSMVPDQSSGPARIFAFHDDLQVGSVDSLFFEYFPLGLSNSRFRPNVGVAVFEWSGVQRFSVNDSALTFQALLFDDGSIEINFSSGGTSQLVFNPTIGIQDESGTIGLDFFSETMTTSAAPSRRSYQILPPRVVVTTAVLGASGSLEDVVISAPNPAHVEFEPSVFCGGPSNVISLVRPSDNIVNALDIFGSEQVVTITAKNVEGITLTGEGATNQSGALVRNGSTARIFLEGLNFTHGSNTSSSGGSGLGGALANSGGGEMVAIDCAIIYNEANLGGAGLLCDNSSRTRLTNCTLSENDSILGSAVLVRPGAEVTLVHCTVASNAGDGALFTDGAATLTLDSCIVANLGATGSSEVNGNSGGTLILRRSNLIRSNSGPYQNQLNPGSLIGTSSVPVNAALVGDRKEGSGLALNGGFTFNLLPTPESPAINRGSLPGKDQRGRFRVGSADLGATEAEWGDTLSSFDPFATPVFDFMTASEVFTAEPTDSFFRNDSSLANDNDETTPTVTSANWGITFTTEMKPRALVPRGIRYFDSSSTPDLFLFYGTNDGIKFELLGSVDLDSIAGTGSKEFFLRSSSVSPSHLLSRGYRQFRLQMESSRPGFGGNGIDEFEILVAPPTPDIYAIRQPAQGNFLLLDAEVKPGQTYDLFQGSDLEAGLTFNSSFTASSNPGVFAATLIVGKPSPERGFYQLRERP